MQPPRNERQKAGSTSDVQPAEYIIKQPLQDLAVTAKLELRVPIKKQPTGTAPCASKSASPDITDSQMVVVSDFETGAEPTEGVSPGTPTREDAAAMALSGCTTPRSESSDTGDEGQAACRADQMCQNISTTSISAADLPLSSPRQLQAVSSEDGEATDGHQDDQSPPCPEEAVDISSWTPVPPASPTSNTDKVLDTA